MEALFPTYISFQCGLKQRWENRKKTTLENEGLGGRSHSYFSISLSCPDCHAEFPICSNTTGALSNFYSIFFKLLSSPFREMMILRGNDNRYIFFSFYTTIITSIHVDFYYDSMLLANLLKKIATPSALPYKHLPIYPINSVNMVTLFEDSYFLIKKRKAAMKLRIYIILILLL